MVADRKKKLEYFQAKVGEKVNSSQTTRPVGYFICDGLHRVRDCPKKEKINALIATDEDNNELETPARVNPLQLLNAIQVETHKGLMYVEMVMGEQKVVALVDSGETHNFVST